MGERVEVRRLMAWFNEKFFEEASNPLVTERIYKRFMSEGRRRPAVSRCDPRGEGKCALSSGRYLGWLARRGNYLAGNRISYADSAAAAHLSAIDYLGDVPWSEDDAAKAWYARVKSRPSFLPAQRMAGGRAGVTHLCGPRLLIVSIATVPSGRGEAGLCRHA